MIILNGFSKIYKRYLLAESSGSQVLLIIHFQILLEPIGKSYSSNVLVRLIGNWKKVFLIDLSKAFGCIPNELLITQNAKTR